MTKPVHIHIQYGDEFRQQAKEPRSEILSGIRVLVGKQCLMGGEYRNDYLISNVKNLLECAERVDSGNSCTVYFHEYPPDKLIFMPKNPTTTQIAFLKFKQHTSVNPQIPENGLPVRNDELVSEIYDSGLEFYDRLIDNNTSWKNRENIKEIKSILNNIK